MNPRELGAGLMLASAMVLMSPLPASGATVDRVSLAPVVASVVSTQDEGVTNEDVLAAFLGFLTGAVTVGGVSVAAKQHHGRKAEFTRDRLSSAGLARESLSECLAAVRAVNFARAVNRDVDEMSIIDSMAHASARFQTSSYAFGFLPKDTELLLEMLRAVLIGDPETRKEAEGNLDRYVCMLLERLDYEVHKAA